MPKTFMQIATEFSDRAGSSDALTKWIVSEWLTKYQVIGTLRDTHGIDITNSTIDYYVKIGLIDPPLVSWKRTGDGRGKASYYHPMAVDTIFNAREAQKKGITLSDFMAKFVPYLGEKYEFTPLPSQNHDFIVSSENGATDLIRKDGYMGVSREAAYGEDFNEILSKRFENLSKALIDGLYWIVDDSHQTLPMSLEEYLDVQFSRDWTSGEVAADIEAAKKTENGLYAGWFDALKTIAQVIVEKDVGEPVDEEGYSEEIFTKIVNTIDNIFKSNPDIQTLFRHHYSSLLSLNLQKLYYKLTTSMSLIERHKVANLERGIYRTSVVTTYLETVDSAKDTTMSIIADRILGPETCNCDEE